MSEMVDPMDSLVGYQAAFAQGLIAPIQCRMSPDVKVFVDEPKGPSGPRRFSYTIFENDTAIALALLITGQPLNGKPCFDLGYAVAETHRKLGLAEKVVQAAISEMQYGLSANGVTEFYVEAIVGRGNIASQKVAAKTVQSTPSEVTDSYSGEPAYRYVRLIESARQDD